MQKSNWQGHRGIGDSCDHNCQVKVYYRQVCAQRKAQVGLFTLRRERFWGSSTAGATPCTKGREIWHACAKGPLSRAKFHPHRCTNCNDKGVRPQNWKILIFQFFQFCRPTGYKLCKFRKNRQDVSLPPFRMHQLLKFGWIYSYWRVMELLGVLSQVKEEVFPQTFRALSGKTMCRTPKSFWGASYFFLSFVSSKRLKIVATTIFNYLLYRIDKKKKNPFNPVFNAQRAPPWSGLTGHRSCRIANDCVHIALLELLDKFTLTIECAM